MINIEAAISLAQGWFSIDESSRHSMSPYYPTARGALDARYRRMRPLWMLEFTAKSQISRS